MHWFMIFCLAIAIPFYRRNCLTLVCELILLAYILDINIVRKHYIIAYISIVIENIHLY